jgi:hypothetical protein
MLLAAVAIPDAAGAEWLRLSTAPRSTDIFDRLDDAVSRPLPALPPAPAPAARRPVWVPDRYVPVPGVDGLVHVPAHWETALPSGERQAPPLPGTTTDGRLIQFPGGTIPAPERRQAP